MRTVKGLTIGILLLLGAMLVSPAIAGDAKDSAAETARRLRPVRHLPVTVIEGIGTHEPVTDDGRPLPFRPTMGKESYRQAKSAANAAATLGLTKLDVLTLTGVDGPVGTAAAQLKTSFNGVDRSAAATANPPDTNAAASKTQVLELVNSTMRVYPRSCGSSCLPAASQTLRSFFNYSATLIFDPRVRYDPTWNRWVIIGAGRHESSSVQKLFVAVSKSATISTTTPSSSFWRFSIDVEPSTGNVFDFPNLGMSQDALVITADRFTGDVPCAAVLAIPKATIYNGLHPGDAGVGVPEFSCLGQATMAPPIQLDQRATTFLLQADPSGSSLYVWGLTNAAYPEDAYAFFQGDVPLGFTYTVPPSAAQPGTAALLDTLDSRFAQAGTQYANHLWNTHVVGYEGSPYPLPLAVDVDPYELTLHSATFYWASATSYDWNAALQANRQSEVFVTYNSTDPSAAVHVQVRAATTTAGPLGPGTAVFTSPTFYAPGFDRACDSGFTCERWGDYASVALDPAQVSGCGTGPLRSAWIVNETAKSTALWGSRIAHVC